MSQANGRTSKKTLGQERSAHGGGNPKKPIWRPWGPGRLEMGLEKLADQLRSSIVGPWTLIQVHGKSWRALLIYFLF